MSNNAIERPDAAAVVADAVLLFCTGVLALSLLWLAVCTAVCLVDRVRGGVAPAVGLLRPRCVQLAVAMALGSSVAASGTPAGADPLLRRHDGLPQVLEGLPTPDRAYGGVRLHVVRPGESLWAIAAEGWPRLHRLNRDRLGPDPDVVHPGTRLRLPPSVSRQVPGDVPRHVPRPIEGAAR